MRSWLFRAVLGLAPEGFRRGCGDDLVAVHERRMTERTGASAFWFGAREVAGLAAVVVRLRIEDLGFSGGGGWEMGKEVAHDLRYAYRTLSRNKGFTAAAVVVLALGIGANTAIFSAVNAFFFRPLPFAEPDRLVMLYETNPEFGWEDAQAAPANVLDWREQVSSFEQVSAYSEFISRFTTVRDGEPQLVAGTQVMGNFFDALGVPAAHGRTLRMEDTWDGTEEGVVLSHDFWVRSFGADPSIVGTRLEFADSRPEIIGVMPPGFNFPSSATELWFTPKWSTDVRGQTWFRRAHFVRAFGRLAPGVDIEAADAEFQTVVERLQRDYPETNRVMGAGMTPFRTFLVKDVRTPLMVLVGAVALLLLLACTNVANLMLVRGNDRAREVALRRALGAGRFRVVRQLLTESGLLALLGGATGLFLGWFGVRAIGASSPLGIDGATSLTLDHRVVGFTLLAAGVSGMLFGIAPALRATGRSVDGSLREGGRGGSAGRSGLRTVSTLVTAEIALAMLLVVGAGLMVRTYVGLRQIDPGFSPEGVVAMQFTVPSARYQTRDDVLAFYERLDEMLEARPGIEEVGLVAQLPLGGTNWSSQFQAEGWPPERVGFDILHRRANADFFETVGTPLVRGRLFSETDGPDDPLVVVINETFAREHFPGEDPIGQRIAYDRAATAESNWYEIVGIVGDQHQVSPATPPEAEVFEHAWQDWGRTEWTVVRTSGDIENAIVAFRAVLEELDPLIPVAETRALEDVRAGSVAREEFVLTLLGAFGVIALILASVGVYGVTAQAARVRTREIGIRIALGAGGNDVLGMIFVQGGVVIGLGLAVGLVASLASARALESLLYGVQPTDPLTLATVIAVLGGVALTAVFIPARRATRVDPVDSLRAE